MKPITLRSEHFVNAEPEGYLNVQEEATINIRDGRNYVLLYSDQTGGGGKLVSHLKKKMEQK